MRRVVVQKRIDRRLSLQGRGFVETSFTKRRDSFFFVVGENIGQCIPFTCLVVETAAPVAVHAAIAALTDRLARSA